MRTAHKFFVAILTGFHHIYSNIYLVSDADDYLITDDDDNFITDESDY